MDLSLFVCSCSILSNIVLITFMKFWNWFSDNEESMESGKSVGSALLAENHFNDRDGSFDMGQFRF